MNSPTPVGVYQGCLLSPTLFNIYMKQVISDALEDQTSTASTGGRTITNLHFAHDIDGFEGKEEELTNLVSHLDKASMRYEMEINTKETKLMMNSDNTITTGIIVHGKKLETIQQFKYYGAIISDDG